MQTVVERLGLPTEMSERSSLLLDVAAALVRTLTFRFWRLCSLCLS